MSRREDQSSDPLAAKYARPLGSKADHTTKRTPMRALARPVVITAATALFAISALAGCSSSDSNPAPTPTSFVMEDNAMMSESPDAMISKSPSS